MSLCTIYSQYVPASVIPAQLVTRRRRGDIVMLPWFCPCFALTVWKKRSLPASSFKLADMFTVPRRWTQLILEVRSQWSMSLANMGRLASYTMNCLCFMCFILMHMPLKGFYTTSDQLEGKKDVLYIWWMKRTKTYRILEFIQDPWWKSYINFNSQKRKKDKTNFRHTFLNWWIMQSLAKSWKMWETELIY